MLSHALERVHIPRARSGRVTLLPGAPAASAALHAVDTAGEWAARGQIPVAVLMLHLSRLQTPGAQPHHRRVAAALLEHAGRPAGGHVFTLTNGDVVLVTHPALGAAVAPTLSRLFRAEMPGADRLLSLWTLPQDLVAVRAEILAAKGEAPPAADHPVRIGAVAAVEAVIRSTPLDRLFRRQIAVHVAGRVIEPLFQEHSLDYALLEAEAQTAVPAAADPFLSRHLAAQLDQRQLRAPPALPGPPLHLNLTLPGVLSPAFQTLPPGCGIELQVIEILSDLPGFEAASDVIRARGHRLVLDGVDHAAFLLIRPEAWQVDLLKLDWSPRMGGLPQRDQRQLAQRIAATGMERIVLHRAETEAAITWGLQQGIRRFQGRTVDAMLAATRIAQCDHQAACSLGQCLSRAAAASPAGQAGCGNPWLLDGAGAPGP